MSLSNNSSKCKLCRREGKKLMLKGERCYLDKCSIEARNFPPGQHGPMKRKKRSGGGDYSEQLREKQTIKRIYGLREKQFKNTFKKAAKKSGITGDVFLQMLETRLDNVVFRMGFAPSRISARQLVLHGHFKVNGAKVNVPSYSLKEGDSVSVVDDSKKLDIIHAALKSSRQKSAESWLEVDKVKLIGKVISIPTREQIAMPVNEQLVVELYSK